MTHEREGPVGGEGECGIDGAILRLLLLVCDWKWVCVDGDWEGDRKGEDEDEDEDEHGKVRKSSEESEDEFAGELKNEVDSAGEGGDE